MKHPAHEMPFDDLIVGLQNAASRGLISIKSSGQYKLYCYSQKTVYDKVWEPHTLVARGLILDYAKKRIAATPFSKFFNYGERDSEWPDIPFEVFTKIDGSLIIIFYDEDDGWRAATKGSFESEQASWTNVYLSRIDTTSLVPGWTYLAEFVGPSNRIVVSYPRDELILLAAYTDNGIEVPYNEIAAIGRGLGWQVAPRHNFAHVSELMACAAGLPHDEEGFVILFADGTRLKVKGEEYRRVHALISGCTPLGLWRAMEAGDDLVTLRQKLPEEFWTDYDQIIMLLNHKIDEVVVEVGLVAAQVANWSDKEVGLKLQEFAEPARTFIFPYRKGNGNLLQGRARAALFRHIRPTGNILEGYVPSYAMNRVLEEAL